MRTSMLITTVALFTTLIMGTCSQAKAADEAITQTTVQTTQINEEMKIKSFTEYDYKMYLNALGGLPTSDALRAQYDVERNAYLSSKTTVQTSVTTQQVIQTNSVTPPDTYDKIIYGLKLIKLIFN